MPFLENLKQRGVFSPPSAPVEDTPFRTQKGDDTIGLISNLMPFLRK